MARFRAIRGCERSAVEQRYICSTLDIWRRLPMERRQEIRELIDRVAETPEEGRALYDVLVRGHSAQAVSARTGVQLNRLYRMRRRFYEEFRI